MQLLRTDINHFLLFGDVSGSVVLFLLLFEVFLVLPVFILGPLAYVVNQNLIKSCLPQNLKCLKLSM